MSTLPLPAIALILLVTVCYVLVCITWPFGTCRRCNGEKKIVAYFGLLGSNTKRQCPRCRHTGIRLRIGRRAWNHYRDLTQDATRPDPRTLRR